MAKKFVTGAVLKEDGIGTSLLDCENQADQHGPLSLSAYKCLVQGSDRSSDGGHARSAELTDGGMELKSSCKDNNQSETGYQDDSSLKTECDEPAVLGECQLKNAGLLLLADRDVGGDYSDPINHLAEIWTEIEREGAVKLAAIGQEGKRSRRRRLRAEKQANFAPPVDQSQEGGEGKWQEVRLAGCMTLDQAVASGFTGPDRVIEDIPVDVIERHRLNVEQIRQLDRFKDYSPGDLPSQTLYLKNMTTRVTQDDLVSLFRRFQRQNEPSIKYRLLSGRMRGQAFVSFPTCEAATAALNLVNGYHFRGKPIIIQYGNKT